MEPVAAYLNIPEIVRIAQVNCFKYFIFVFNDLGSSYISDNVMFL